MQPLRILYPRGCPEAVQNPPGKILNSKSEIPNNLKIQMFKIPNVSVIRMSLP